MNKILWSVATTIAVVGGTALAASMPIHVQTTTYKPGTPNSLTYPGSPNEVGQSSSQASSAPATSSVAPATTSSTLSSSSPTTTTASTTSPTVSSNNGELSCPAGDIGFNNKCWTPQQAYQSGYIQYSDPYLRHMTATVYPNALQQPLAGMKGWDFNGVTFVTPANAQKVEDTPNTVAFQWTWGAVNVTVTPGSVYGSSWTWDQTHFQAFINQLYSVPSKGWTPQVNPGSVQGIHHYALSMSPSNMPLESEAFTLPDNQTIAAFVTPAGLYTVAYTGYVPASFWPNIYVLP